MVAAVLASACTPQQGLLPPAAAAADSSVAGAYLAGRFALSQGDLATAAEGLARALELVPEDADLRHQVLLLETASGDLETADALARALMDADEPQRAADARLIRAIVARAEGEGDATALLEALPDDTMPGLVRPLLTAWAAPTPGEGAERLAAADRRLGDLVVLHHALLLDAADRPDEALAELAELGREPQELSDRVLATQARLLARVGEIDAAGAVLRLGRGGETGSVVIETAARTLARGEVPAALITDADAGMADALLGFADLLRAQRRPLHATVYARLATHIAPDYAPGWLMVARLLLDQDGAASAIEAYAEVDRSSPWWRQAQLESAEAKATGGDVDSAVADLEALMAASGADPQPAIVLGDVLRRAERFDEAAEAYAAALELSGGLDAPLWRLQYARGIALERSRRWPEAEAALRRALELEPDQPFILNYLGYSWVDQGLYLDEAKAMLYRAVELRPNDGFIVDSLGWAYYRLGEYAKAVIHLERAVELEPGDPVINDHLGDALWKVGRVREARFQWERALTLDPEPENVPDIEAKLRDGLESGEPG